MWKMIHHARRGLLVLLSKPGEAVSNENQYRHTYLIVSMSSSVDNVFHFVKILSTRRSVVSSKAEEKNTDVGKEEIFFRARRKEVL